MIEFFERLWVQNWYFSYFLCHCFDFFLVLVLETGLHGYFVLVFIPKSLASITFGRFTKLQSETTSRIIATSPSNLLWKMWIWVFYEYYALLLLFVRNMAKNNPTEKQIDAEIQATFKHGPAWKLENSLQTTKTDLNHKLQLLASEYQQQSLGGIAKFSKNTYARI